MNDLVKFNLANITEALSQANLVVATEKRINSLSDDPVGLTQVLNIKSSLDGIEQLGRNINITDRNGIDLAFALSITHVRSEADITLVWVE